jgi:hypothetical protein
MRENLNAIKRLVAFFLTVFLFATTVWNDVFVIATEENHCSEYVDEQTYAANVLQPVGEGDGYCDHCGQVVQAHVHEEPASEPAEETAAVDEAAPETEAEGEVQNPEATNPEVANPDPAAEEPEGGATGDTAAENEIDNPDNSDKTPTDETDIETTPEEELDEDELTDEELAEEEELEEEEEEECEHEWSYTSNNNGTHIKKCKLCDEEVEEECLLDDNGVCHLCGYEDERLVYQSTTKKIFGTVVTVSGKMPRGSYVEIYYTGTKPVEDIINENTEEKNVTALVAFDINIYRRGGEKYQPQEDGGSVNVRFAGVDEVEELAPEEVSVYRIEDNDTVTKIDCQVDGENVSFKADHFTIYAAAATNLTNPSTQILESYEHFAMIGSTGSNEYTTLTKAYFYVYFPTAGTINFTIDTYKNLTSATNPISNTPLYASETVTVTGAKGEYKEVGVNFTPTASSYITANKYYSVVVSANETCNVVVGQGQIKSYIYTTSDEWVDNGNYEGIFQIESNNTAPTDSSLTIASIKDQDGNELLKANESYIYYYGKNDTDTFTATFNEANVDRTITWAYGTTTSSSVVQIVSTTSTTASIKAVGAGSAQITATYGGSTKTININVLEFKVGTDSFDDYSVQYTGTVIHPDVKGYITGAAESNLAVTYDDDNELYSNVNDDAKVYLTYTSPGDSSYKKTWTKSFKITPLEITADVFYIDTNSDGKNDRNVEFTVAAGEIQSMTGMGKISANTGKPNATQVDLVYNQNNQDFSAIITNTAPSSGGLKYTIAISGIGNFTGDFEVTLTNGTGLTKIDSILKAQARGNGLSDKFYTGNDFALTDRYDSTTLLGWNEVEFVGNDEVAVDEIVTKETADVTITDLTTGASDAASAGLKKITFTMKQNSGYEGSLSVNFRIYPANISAATIEWKDTSRNFKHKEGDAEVQPQPDTDFEVKFGGNVVHEFADDDKTIRNFTVSYSNNTAITSNARVILTGNGNFTGEKTDTFNIVANFANDVVVIINDGTEYRATAANDFNFTTAGYTRLYDPTFGENLANVYSLFSVQIPGNRAAGSTLSQGTDYTIQVYDEGSTTLTADVKTKKIVKITPSAEIKTEFGITDSGEVIASFDISPRTIANSAISKNFTRPTGKKYTGKPIVITRASSHGESANLELYYTAKGYTLGPDDYDVTYNDTNINAGTAKLTITGKGNFTGTVSGTAYTFTIGKASLQDSNVTIEWPSDMPYTYDGTAKEPVMTVKIDGNTIGEFADEAKTIRNYTVSYSNNVNATTSTNPATVTITAGTNGNDGKNLVNSIVKTFTISPRNAQITGIKIGGDNGVPATLVNSAANPQIWTCDGLNVSYTGNVYKGNPAVYTADGKIDSANYYVSYSPDPSVRKYNTSNPTASPYIKIAGRGNYAGTNAIVLYHISPVVIAENDPDLNVEWTKKYDYTGSDVALTISTITYKGNPLTTPADYTIEYPDDKASAGKKTAKIKFTGSYAYKDSANTDGYPLDYTVGINIDDAQTQISFTNPFYTAAGTEEGFYETTGTGYRVRWINGYSPIVHLVWKKADNTTAVEEWFNGSANETKSGSEVDFVDAQSMTTLPNKYDSRPAGNEANTYNTITVTVTPKANTQFYGTRTITYEIQPMDIGASGDIITRAGTIREYPYTGALITPIVKLQYKYGTDSANTYNLNTKIEGGQEVATTADFKLNIDTIGPASTESTIQRKIQGHGNFRGETTVVFEISKGDVTLWLQPKAGGNPIALTPLVKPDSTSDNQTFEITDQESYHYQKGQEFKPNLYLKDASGTNPLTADECEGPVYTNYNVPSKNGVKATAVFTVKNGGNYKPRTITVTYTILTNDIDDGTGVLSIGGTGSVPYTAKKYDASEIKTAVDRDPSILTVKFGSQTLKYGSDYKILVPEDTSAVSDFNKWKETKNDNSDVIGRNTLPSYADVGGTSLNYFWVEGINDYSGFIKVPFNIILNLAEDSLTAITIKDASYELNNDGSCTNEDGTSKITPEVTFRAIDGATGTYGETLPANDTKKYLNITRTKEGYPGPDGSITVSGIKGCKGTVSNLKYYDTTTSTKVPVKFLARLGNYTKIKSTGEVYPYTGSAVEVSFIGIDEEAVKVNDVRLLGDYVLTYEDTASPANIYATTVNVGTYRARITATEKSSYFVPGTSQAYEYKIKYNLANAVIKFYDPGNNTVEIEQVPYTSGGYDLASNAKLFINNKEIYPTGGNGDTTGWVTFTPSKLIKVGKNQPVTVTSNNDLVYGTCTGYDMSVGGISIDSATIKIVGKTAPYEYDYTGDYITPTVSVELGTETLELTRDYTVSYKDNKNAGTATIIVNGTGAYSGTAPVTFTINKVAITADMIEVGDAFYAGYGIEVKPTVTVKNKSGMTLSPNIEYEVRYERNSSGARDKSSTTPLPPAVYVTAKPNSNYTGTNIEKAFTIEKLDLSSTDVNVDIETTEYTGQELKEYDIIKVFVGTKELDPTGKTSGAEDYRIDIYNASGQPAKLLDKGQYTIDIVGLEVNTTGTKELHIEITDRSLPNNWHYYFDGNDFSSSTSTWSYVPSKKAFVSQPVAGSKDNLIITVYDVEEFTEGTEVTPRITIEDKGIQISTTTTNEDGTTTTVSKNKVLTKDDFEITKVINGDKAGTGEWSRILKTDGTHALPTADSPAVEIKGIGNYTGSITLPFNIGKNLNTLIEESSLHVEFTVTNSYYTSSGSQTNKYDYGATSISYIYNSNTQIPEPKLDYTYTPTGATSSRTITLTKGTEYTVSVEDAKGEEDSSVNAGEKYIVIKGKGKYCGTIKQKYVITKKLVDETTETGFDKDATKTMQTVDGGYTFVVLGNTVTRLNEDTAKKYLYDEANPTKYRDYIGYYYAVFNKEPIEPKVQVKDNKLGPLKNKSVVISEDDLVIDYKKADESFDPGQNNFSEIQISFKANAAESSAGLNYYATSTGSATFVIHYIVVQGDLSSGFTVDFVNGTAGANTDFDGTEKTPDIVVTNGSKELVENQDYTKEYRNNILPGVAEVVVTGMGNYKGQTSNTFTISGNLGTDTVEAYQDINGNYVEGKLTQDYIGGAFEPNILLMIPETSAMIAAGIPEVDRVLTYSGNGGNAQTDDYTLVGEPTSTNGFVSSGTVVYAGNGARYWKGTKEINFNIAFDEANLDLTNKNQSYPYTGKEIKPAFKLPLSEKVYEIKNIQYLRNGTDATDFVNAGSIDVIVTAKVGEQDREFYDTYTITKRNLNDSNVRVIYTKNYRYTGSQIKPPVVVFIQNESSVHTLVEGTDYKLEYGKNTGGYLENKEEGSITIRGMGTNIESVRMEHFNIDVGFPVNVQIPKDKITSSSVTVTWTPDVYSTGDIVKLYKVDSDKNETYVGEKNITDHTGECTFTGLDSVADYKAYVQSYVKTSNDEFLSEVRSAEAITGIQTSSVNVVSNAPGTVTISDWPKDGAVIIYKIYRADTADTSVPGTLVACYPASVNSFTNTGLARGKYYYYVEGYCVLNSKLTCANTSERVPVDVE